MKMRFSWGVLLLLWSLGLKSQNLPTNQIRKALTAYLQGYSHKNCTSDNPVRLTDVQILPSGKSLNIVLNEAFAEQPFTKESVQLIYRDVARRLPPPYNTYRLAIYCNTTPIEEYIPQAWSDTTRTLRSWGNITYKGDPWVSPLSRNFRPSQGLLNRHLALWASHGRYYDIATHTWLWQRPRLYCTTEDLFTQSFVVPFLMPMLENAGALVFSPRERDWQHHQALVDNDMPGYTASYSETNGTHEWQTGGVGFGDGQDVYQDHDNPFERGTFRMADTQSSRRLPCTITWQPEIPAHGRYAVYVSYATVPTSVSDAQYTVYHNGGVSRFKVNQKMGGGTWVYLGTFEFAAGRSSENCVVLTNVSNYRGTVTADAVRFGGGMGNVARTDSLYAPLRSGLPRFLEGSRYLAQWSGMPYEVYSVREGQNDYADDINARSLMTNRLARGSVYLPGDSGLAVPLELALAVHSDAGYRTDHSLIGTLGIYTTGIYTKGTYEGLLAEGMLPAGISRMTSRDLCDHIMTHVTTDMTRLCGGWVRRQMYDRNYSESRVPEIPSAILETLSHQNWADLRFGHDPWFKFLFSRAIYKGILQYVTGMHGPEKHQVQPMPVTDFAVQLNASEDSVHLSWRATADPTDAAAIPSHFLVYTAEGHRSYDHGTIAYAPHITLPIQRGVLMRFRVTAVNAGGQSMDSEELCAYAAPARSKRILIVNGFQRLAGPQPVDNDSLRGFDMNADPGVVYHRSPCYSGRQTNFSKTSFTTLGESGSEYEGLLVAGNTFDYPTLHARDIIAIVPSVSISSASRAAFESGQTDLRNTAVIDLILGAQRQDGYSLTSSPAFTERTCRLLENFTHQGGSLLVSGAYLSEELAAEPMQTFARQVLHAQPRGMYALGAATSQVEGMGTYFPLFHELNEQRYATRRSSILEPAEGGFCTLLYSHGNLSAAVAWQSGPQRSMTFGFPLESIADEGTRRAVIGASIQFLIQ